VRLDHHLQQAEYRQGTQRLDEGRHANDGHEQEPAEPKRAVEPTKDRTKVTQHGGMIAPRVLRLKSPGITGVAIRRWAGRRRIVWLMRTTFVLKTRQLVQRDLESTFALFAEAGNLQQLTPPWLDFATVTPLPIVMRAGTRIDYRLRLHGIPIRWQTLISDWNPPHSFVDQQISGPYRLWQHRHTFTGVRSGTLVEDEVRYQVVGGRLVNWFVRRDLERIFRFRHEALVDALQQTRADGSIIFDG
jgi:ligand-binding SRPBCC domain-containing protein